MSFVIIVFSLLLFSLGCYCYGAYRLSKYAKRVSSSKGMLVLLVPPYTFYFAFSELNEAGKSTPTAFATFGVTAFVVTLIFFGGTVGDVLSGNLAPYKEPVGISQQAEKAEEDKKEAKLDKPMAKDAGETDTTEADAGKTDAADAKAGDAANTNSDGKAEKEEGDKDDEKE